jgi:hypothetical protein
MKGKADDVIKWPGNKIIKWARCQDNSADVAWMQAYGCVAGLLPDDTAAQALSP